MAGSFLLILVPLIILILINRDFAKWTFLYLMFGGTYSMIFSVYLTRYFENKNRKEFFSTYGICFELIIIFVVTITILILLMVFDFEQYNITPDRKRQFEFAMLGITLFWSVLYSFISFDLKERLIKKVLKFYLLPILFGLLATILGYAIIGSSLIAFILFGIVFCSFIFIIYKAESKIPIYNKKV